MSIKKSLLIKCLIEPPKEIKSLKAAVHACQSDTEKQKEEVFETILEDPNNMKISNFSQSWF